MKRALLLSAVAGIASLCILSSSGADVPRIGNPGNPGPVIAPHSPPTILKAGGSNPRPQGVAVPMKRSAGDKPSWKPVDPPSTIKAPPGATGQVFSFIPGQAPTVATGFWASMTAGSALLRYDSGQPTKVLIEGRAASDHGVERVLQVAFTPESPTQSYAFACGVKGAGKYTAIVDAFRIGTSVGDHDTDTVLLSETLSAPSGTVIVSYEPTTPTPSFVTLWLSGDSQWQVLGCQGYRMP